MEPLHAAKICLVPDPDVVEVPMSSSSIWSSNNQKRKRTFVPTEIVDVDKDDDPKEVVFINENDSNCKNKQPVTFNNSWAKQLKVRGDALFSNHVGSSTTHIPNDVAPLNSLTSSKQGSLDFNLLHGYCTYDDYEFDDDYLEGCEIDDDVTDYYMVEKFGDLDLTPGIDIEATTSCMPECAADRPSTSKPKPMNADALDMKYLSFKQFDTVEGDYDHYFSKPEHNIGIKAVKEASKDWTKRIQHEWKVLENDLPEKIYVRVYENRMELLRAVIVGAAGTPYHDGLFFFDVYFPPNYPNVPPMVHYHSGGLRLNPNLYACGKVCLSLLGTWSGYGCERWDRSRSTMLQVLVSIQALVLNAKPYFNEPGFERSAGHPNGEKWSLCYNEETFLLSCKTMLYSLRKPPKHFEDFVVGYFRDKSNTILVACRAYLDGAQVGSLVGEGVQHVGEGDKGCSLNFRNSLKVIFDDLLVELAATGADCDKFLATKAKEGAGENADNTLKI